MDTEKISKISTQSRMYRKKKNVFEHGLIGHAIHRTVFSNPTNNWCALCIFWKL